MRRLELEQFQMAEGATGRHGGWIEIIGSCFSGRLCSPPHSFEGSMSKPDRSRELRELRALVSENNFCINCRSKVRVGPR